MKKQITKLETWTLKFTVAKMHQECNFKSRMKAHKYAARSTASKMSQENKMTDV